MIESCDCPHCGEPCDRDQVDVGVGVIHGPWGCANCGWSSSPEYDCRGGVRHDGDKRVFDQYGSSHHVERPGGMAVLAGANVNLVTDHEYLSAGDTPYASGDRPYTGCFLCGKPRSKHARGATK